MILDYFQPSVLIVLAGGTQVLGYLLINQTLLRLAMFLGTSFYIAYYFTVADTPLWEAIMVSSMTLVTIVIGLASLYAKQANWSVPREHLDIYPMFGKLLPGDFRKIVKCARREVLATAQVVTKQGVRPENMYFVTAGTFQVEKGAAQFEVPGPTFVGEVAFLMDAPSAATTTLPAGTEVLVWSRDNLARQAAKSPRFKMALDAVISHDLARKVSHAVAPAT